MADSKLGLVKCNSTAPPQYHEPTAPPSDCWSNIGYHPPSLSPPHLAHRVKEQTVLATILQSRGLFSALSSCCWAMHRLAQASSSRNQHHEWPGVGGRDIRGGSTLTLPSGMLLGPGNQFHRLFLPLHCMPDSCPVQALSTVQLNAPEARGGQGHTDRSCRKR